MKVIVAGRTDFKHSLYRIDRYYVDFDVPPRTIMVNKTASEVYSHLQGPESSSKTAKKPESIRDTIKSGQWHDVAVPIENRVDI